MLSQLKQQFMLPQLAFGALETAFNALIQRSPQVLPALRKLTGKCLHIELTSPAFNFYLIFSETRAEWLSIYEGEADCHVQLSFETLPKLADKAKLTELINNKSLILNGDIQVLQHFTALLDELEKDPAELLSPFVGDVVAQTSTDLAKKLFGKIKGQFERNHQHITDNLMNEYPVLVHRLQAVNFYDEVAELEQKTVEFERKFAKLENKS
ncbi:ubiquinone biosynthesis accessory factor UbiJ [Actinobacillus vicugnae]|uniref:ubiquinone biosynthesis accessory factor UbiJ n=1 Tax=Actinobacillus vicugnae TaxID=2573093 RepID=UPI00123FB1BF|nr:SCP2 sterol-binding domain-containing protein [Actinobacillus vicugnae]